MGDLARIWHEAPGVMLEPMASSSKKIGAGQALSDRERVTGIEPALSAWARHHASLAGRPARVRNPALHMVDPTPMNLRWNASETHPCGAVERLRARRPDRFDSLARQAGHTGCWGSHRAPMTRRSGCPEKYLRPRPAS